MVEEFLIETFDVLVSAMMPFFALLAVPLVGGLVVEVLNYSGRKREPLWRRVLASISGGPLQSGLGKTIRPQPSRQRVPRTPGFIEGLAYFLRRVGGVEHLGVVAPAPSRRKTRS